MKKRLLLIIVAFCVSFTSMIALSLFSMERFSRFTNFSDQVDHTNMVIISIRSAEVSLRDIGLAERGYMITHDTMYVRHLNNAIDTINQVVNNLGQITNDNPEQQRNITLLKASIAIRIAAVRNNIAYVDTSNTNIPSQYYYDSRAQMIECSQRLRAMRKGENTLFAERLKGEQIYQQLTSSTLKYLLVIFCIIALILFIIMIRELRGRMQFQEELQAKVIDLKRSHNELQEIAFAASHDLQEPLRKIQVFCDMLLFKTWSNTDDDGKATLKRIKVSAARMQILIADLNALISLTKIDEHKNVVNLNNLVQQVVLTIDERIIEKEAVIERQQLPIINGYENQLKILFEALLDNSLKFTREGVKPVITFSSDIVNGHELSDINPNLSGQKFHRITCADNGIGFENQFITKIFQIFQRLHPQESEYDGKGIGLAICQRIMANHEGYIIASGTPGMGAQFKLFFPADS